MIPSVQKGLDRARAVASAFRQSLAQPLPSSTGATLAAANGHSDAASPDGELEMAVARGHEILDSGPPSSLNGSLPLRSETCTERHFYLDSYRFWIDAIKEQRRFHRKQWEFFYVAQALWERGMLESGRRGLGFGVGHEPLVALFAHHGCDLLATDLATDEATAAGWRDTGQHAADMGELNSRAICDPDDFSNRVDFRFVDMNDIPPDLRGFDFAWSSCALEHLGTIDLGLEFIINSLDTVRPGGWVVHTTEMNVNSNDRTVSEGATVLFRKCDLEHVAARATALGHRVEPLLLGQSSSPLDAYVDLPPYRTEPHLRLAIGEFETTSVGVIIQRGVDS